MPSIEELDDMWVIEVVDDLDEPFSQDVPKSEPDPQRRETRKIRVSEISDLLAQTRPHQTIRMTAVRKT